MEQDTYCCRIRTPFQYRFHKKEIKHLNQSLNRNSVGLGHAQPGNCPIGPVRPTKRPTGGDFLTPDNSRLAERARTGPKGRRRGTLVWEEGKKGVCGFRFHLARPRTIPGTTTILSTSIYCANQQVGSDSSFVFTK